MDMVLLDEPRSADLGVLLQEDRANAKDLGRDLLDSLLLFGTLVDDAEKKTGLDSVSAVGSPPHGGYLDSSASRHQA